MGKSHQDILVATFTRNIDYLAVERLKGGDLKSFDELFHKYSSRIYNFSLKYLKSPEDAEEIVQNVFLYVWDKRDILKPDLSFNAYIFTIAFNIIKKQFIKKSRENAFKDELIYNLLEQDNSLDKMIDYKFFLEKVETIIDTLPPRRKEVFLKRKYEGLSIKQIAVQLGVSPHTVENHLASAQKQIMEELQKEKLAGLIFFMLFVKI